MLISFQIGNSFNHKYKLSYYIFVRFLKYKRKKDLEYLRKKLQNKCLNKLIEIIIKQ
jgi:hypothetical protein